jgi:hypothetical protein
MEAGKLRIVARRTRSSNGSRAGRDSFGVGTGDGSARGRAARSGAQILHGPGCRFIECSGSVERPIRIAQHFAGEEDEIGLAAGDEVVGLMRVGDHADGGGGNGGFGANASCEGSLECGPDGNLGIGDLAAGGNVDEIDAVCAEMTGESDGFVDGPAIPAIFGPVGGGDADEDGQVRGPRGAYGVDNLKEETDAIVESAAVGVGALIGERGEEFVEEVAVGGVNLDEVEAGVVGAMGGLREGVNNGVDAGLVEGLRNGVVRREGNGAGTEGLPAAFVGLKEAFATERRGHGGFAAGVSELNSGANALRVDKLGDAGEGGNVVVGIDAEVGRRDASFGEDRGCLEHNEGGSALGTRAEMNEVPVVGEAVLRGVLAHGRDADAIGESDGAKLKGRKKRMAHESVCA